MPTVNNPTPSPRRGASAKAAHAPPLRRRAFEPGDRVETYIGSARITGTVETYEEGVTRRYPLIIERGEPGTVYEGWVKVEETRPGNISFVSDAKKKIVQRTSDHVRRIEE